jgi:hypothetical protein
MKLSKKVADRERPLNGPRPRVRDLALDVAEGLPPVRGESCTYNPR